MQKLIAISVKHRRALAWDRRFKVFRFPFGVTLGWWLCALVLCGLFLWSARSGGVTWDEQGDFKTVDQQWEFASNVLFGPGDETFRSIPAHHAFYGIGTLSPARALSYLSDTVWLGEKNTFDKSFSLILHLAAFVSAVAASWYTGRLVYLVTSQRETSVLAAIALLVTPVWIGYGFFDYKDMPVAAGLIATVYYAAGFMTDRHPRKLVFFFAALLFLGAQKIAAIPLALPACLGVAFAVAQERSARLLAIFAAQAIAFLVLLYVITPPSWNEPVAFLRANLDTMARFPWYGCEFTAGECIGRNHANGAGYSALKYLALWYVVQLPVLLQIGLIAAVVLYIRSFRRASLPKHLIAASLIWPIASLAIANSTLYGGIRHTLFLIPVAVSLIFVSIPERFWAQWRPWIVGYGALLLIDTVTLQPYGYVWFNEWARFFANETNYETDYTGFSLREAAALAKSLRGSNEWIVGYPGHSVAPFVTQRYASKVDALPQGNSYLLVQITRHNATPPVGCMTVGQVTRRQLLAPQPLHLAFVARCNP